MFKNKNAKNCAIKYFTLAFVVMVLGMAVMNFTEKAFEGIVILGTLCKLVYDCVMYFINYFIQRDYVFKSAKKQEK